MYGVKYLYGVIKSTLKTGKLFFEHIEKTKNSRTVCRHMANVPYSNHMLNVPQVKFNEFKQLVSSIEFAKSSVDSFRKLSKKSAKFQTWRTKLGIIRKYR